MGETLYINGMPFTIIGMFKHYESEQDRKARELATLQGSPKKQAARLTRASSSSRAAATI